MPIDPSRIHFTDELAADGSVARRGSDVLAQYIRDNTTDTVILPVSRGKDSLATWLQVRRYFPKVIAFHRYLVPGLEFVEDYLKYLEDYFKTPIIRVPDPLTYALLDAGAFQTPESQKVWDGHSMMRWLESQDLRDYFDRMAPPGTWYAVGWKIADSLRRRLTIRQHGGLPGKEDVVSDLGLGQPADPRRGQVGRAEVRAGLSLVPPQLRGHPLRLPGPAEAALPARLPAHPRLLPAGVPRARAPRDVPEQPPWLT